MFDPFVEYTARAPADEVRALSVEDVAVCVAWFQSHANDPTKQAGCAGLQEAIELWVAESMPPNHESEGSRQQPVLRALIDELQAGRLAELHRDELDFLCIIYDLMDRGTPAALFERPKALLAPFIPELQSRRDTLLLIPGLPAMAARVCIVTGEYIQAARPREIRYLVGIEAPGRGPVFSHKGDLKVVDYVPENCTVVVEQGACYVNGFVLGKVVATKHCEVRENISGVVIVTQGDVRVRNIISKAFVVSKSGRIRCRCAQDPRLAFAGESLWIAESATAGRYISPRIEVAREVTGGELHVSESLTADLLRPSPVTGLSVVLRREISCEDYGEEIGPEARRLLAQRAEFRRRLYNLKRMVWLAEQESEHHATSALMFICGGEKTKRLLEEIESAQHRMAFLDRIITGLQTLRETAENSLASVKAASAARQSEPAKLDVAESPSSIADLEQELRELELEGQMDADLTHERDEMVTMGRDLQKKMASANLAASFASRLQEKESIWIAERDNLLARIKEKDKELRRVVGRMEILERAGENTSKVQLLVHLLTVAKQRPPGDELASRVQAVFVRLTLRAINSRIERARKYREMAEEVRQKLREVGEKLQKDFKILMRDEEESAIPPSVIGRFAEGVRLYADRYFLDTPDAPAGTVVVTPGSGEQVVTYVRTDQTITRAEEQLEQ